MTPTIEVTRKGRPFKMVNTEITSSWRFWEQWWAEESWEAGTLDAIDAHLPDGGLLMDIGAWVGPITLWAAQRARVIAIEPDDAAFDQLLANVEMNLLGDDGRVSCIRAAAVANGARTATLRSVADDWGRSTSSLTQTEGLDAEVVTIDVRRGLMGVDLVKIDIEGGEALLLPGLGPELRKLGIPMILSLHPDWYGSVINGERLDAELAHWDRDLIERDTWLCRPGAR